ncbi:MAG: MmgE/PrpD family protein [Albidovulum sp.]|nr:MmgE/PrpD family protein [Albidovulum sp.]
MSQTEVTAELARWIVDLRENDVPPEVRREGVRTFVNWLGCAVGGSKHETVDAALRVLESFSGTRSSTVIARTTRLDALSASLINGISSHVLDFDDTHLKTIIHPAGPVSSALLALAELRPMSSREFLTAQIIGTEVECRIGNSVYPDHYDRGWHITGTAGVFGSAAACGRAIGLGPRQMQWALGLAATQSSGLREMFGTMTKSFHPGAAARNGMMAALLAEAGFDSSEHGIEARRGWANVVSDKRDYGEILGELGRRWESALNSYKPFACGIVIHPAIDGCRKIRDEIGADRVARIDRVELATAPLVLELTGKTSPKTGLEGKFSVFHAAACALLRGDGSPEAFTDEAVNDPGLVAMCARIHVRTDTAIHEDSVSIKVFFEDGTRLEKRIDHAVGSRDNPLTDSQLDEKFIKQARSILGDDRTRILLAKAWRIGASENPAAIARATVPGVEEKSS